MRQDAIKSARLSGIRYNGVVCNGNNSNWHNFCRTTLDSSCCAQSKLTVVLVGEFVKKKQKSGGKINLRCDDWNESSAEQIQNRALT